MPKNKTRKNYKSSNCSKFTKDDYESNNGMMTSIWGPAAWHFLHSISFNYPVNPSVEQKHKYMDFIYSLRNVLPCGKCRDNLANNFKKLPLTLKEMESRDSFSKYIYNLHKTVNTMLGKDTPVTFEEARDIYEHFRARCMPEKTNTGGNSNTKTKKLLSKKPKENGCVIPYYGKKFRCVLHVVPQTKHKCKTFKFIKN